MKAIYVTGSHRSGTSWVAKMLATAPRALFRDEEIFKPIANKYCSGALEPWRWHYCISKSNESQFSKHVDKLVKNQFSLFEAFPYICSKSDFVAVLKKQQRSLLRRFADYETQVFSEPLGIFSTEWFAERYAAQVLLLIRHPASFVSSIVRLGWTYDFSELLAQDNLMAMYLEDFEAELKSPPPSSDVAGQAILLWRIFYRVTYQYQTRHPDWITVRLEDLSKRPRAAYEELFRAFGLPFTEHSAAIIEEHTKAGNTAGAPIGGGDDHRRDASRMVSIWKERLESDVVLRVKEQTEDVWPYWYGEDDW